MSKLFLAGLHQHMYNPTIACAYIYYGTKQHPINHKGVALEEVYQDKKMTDDFIHYLKIMLLPIVNEGLNKTRYRANDIMQLDSPQPFVSVVRRNGSALTEIDITALKNILRRTIEPVTLIDESFFKQQKKVSFKEPVEQNAHRYNLRSKK